MHSRWRETTAVVVLTGVCVGVRCFGFLSLYPIFTEMSWRKDRHVFARVGRRRGRRSAFFSSRLAFHEACRFEIEGLLLWRSFAVLVAPTRLRRPRIVRVGRSYMLLARVTARRLLS